MGLQGESPSRETARRTHLVSTTTPSDRSMSSSGPAGVWAPRRLLGPLDVLMLSAWCGLAAGLLEVGTRVLCRSIDPTNRLYLMSRHFVWLAPISNLMLFAGMGLFLAVATKLWPRRGGWFCPRLITFWAVLPVLMVASPRIYPQAWVILALGVASRLTAILDGHATKLRRWLMVSFPSGQPAVRGRLAQGAARGRPSLAAGRFPECAPDRAGHRPGGPFEPLRV